MSHCANPQIPAGVGIQGFDPRSLQLVRGIAESQLSFGDLKQLTLACDPKPAIVGFLDGVDGNICAVFNLHRPQAVQTDQAAIRARPDYSLTIFKERIHSGLQGFWSVYPLKSAPLSPEQTAISAHPDVCSRIFEKHPNPPVQQPFRSREMLELSVAVMENALITGADPGAAIAAGTHGEHATLPRHRRQMQRLDRARPHLLQLVASTVADPQAARRVHRQAIDGGLPLLVSGDQHLPWPSRFPPEQSRVRGPQPDAARMILDQISDPR